MVMMQIILKSVNYILKVNPDRYALFFILIKISLTLSFIFLTSGHNSFNLVVSKKLLDLPAAKILFCSSIEKFFLKSLTVLLKKNLYT